MKSVGLEKLSYCKLACQPRVICAAIAATMNYIIYCALDPTLTLRLDDYGLEQSTKGLIYSIMPTMYMVGTMVTPCVLPKWMEVRVWLIFAALFLGISVTIVGPFFLDESIVVMCIGLFFTGSMLGPLIIPNMSEMIVAA